jgi:hypothetical protein
MTTNTMSTVTILDSDFSAWDGTETPVTFELLGLTTQGYMSHDRLFWERFFRIPDVTLLHESLIFTERFCNSYSALFEMATDVVMTLIPDYPEEDDRSTNSLDELSMVINLHGQSMVFRQSEIGNRHGGYETIRPIHLYGPDMFHPLGSCDLEDDGECIYCVELKDRLYNSHRGVYDYLNAQITGVFDLVDINATSEELYDYMIDHSLNPIAMAPVVFPLTIAAPPVVTIAELPSPMDGVAVNFILSKQYLRFVWKRVMKMS